MLDTALGRQYTSKADAQAASETPQMRDSPDGRVCLKRRGVNVVSIEHYTHAFWTLRFCY